MNNTVIGSMLVVAGASLLVTGLVLLTMKREDAPQTHHSDTSRPEPARYSPPQSPSLRRAPDLQPNHSGEDLTPLEKGVEFEKYIAKRFSKDYFKIKNWSSDKYVDGVYAESTLNPDFEIEFSLGQARETFAVECKWRSKLEEGIEWATPKQISHYNNYSDINKYPVFVVIGIGGSPNSPHELYILKLNQLKYPYAKRTYLQNFARKNPNGDFFYDYKNKSLK